MKKIFKYLKILIVFLLWTSFIFLFWSTIYSNVNNTESNLELLKVSDNDILNSENWNSLLTNLKLLKEKNQLLKQNIAWLKENISLLNEAPKNAVMAFADSSCPLGWIPADWTSWTPDLRWVFIRWANSFDNWLTSNVRDKDRAIIQAWLWTEQIDAIIEIEWWIATWHSLWLFAATQYWAVKLWYWWYWGSVAGSSWTYNKWFDIKASRSIWEEHVWSDIRPKNVALIYCVKK